ncbi:TIGR04219 family outer membrane beta-barrel protein [Colwellia sp. MEBiC06753]
MKKALLATSLSCMLSATAQADVVGVYIGGQVWATSTEGAFAESSDLVPFDFDDEQQASFYIEVEHPFPVIPNIKVSQSTLDTKGVTTLTDELEFGGETFVAGSTVNAKFDLDYRDYTLYYELFDNGALSFDFGITARDFDGHALLTSQVESTDPEGNPIVIDYSGKNKFSEIVPLLYASTEIGLMFTGLNLVAEGNFLSFDDHTLYDYQVGVSYDLIDNVMVDVNIMAGYRAVKLELNDLSDLYSDIDVDGVYAGVEVHF